jgi:hypothetical protein
MRKFALLAAFISVVCCSLFAEKGGAAPCLATCFFGDPRIGLTMNEGQPIETVDWLRLGGNVIGGALGSTTLGGTLYYTGNAIGLLADVYASYETGYKYSEVPGFCVSMIWGNRPGKMFKEYRLRTKEILLCIPIVQCYPLIALPLEAYNGKTMSDVIAEEGLKR